MQTNLGAENPKMKSVFKNIQNLTPNCDVIISKKNKFRSTKLYGRNTKYACRLIWGQRIQK